MKPGTSISSPAAALNDISSPHTVTVQIAGLAFYQSYLQKNPSTPLLQFAEWFLSSPEFLSDVQITTQQGASAQHWLLLT